MESLDVVIHPKRKLAIWLAKFNSLGLLRAARQARTHCVWRSTHEGGDFGEGMVKLLRHVTHKTLRGRWSMHLVNRHNRTRMLDDHVDHFLRPEQELSPHGAITEDEQKDFIRCKNKQTASELLPKLKPISVLVHRNAHTKELVTGSVHKLQKNWRLMFHTMDLSTKQDPMGCTYFDFSHTQENVDLGSGKNINIDGHTFLGYGVMLPDLWNDPDETNSKFRYCILMEGGRKVDKNSLVTYMI